MTPRQARLALCGFALLTAGVAVNVLYVQRRVETANGFVERRPQATIAPREGARRGSGSAAATRQPADGATTAAEERPARKARLDPNSARVELLPETPQSEAGAETVRAIQRELVQRGYGPLQADGRVGLATRAAIMAFEHDRGLPLTAEPGEALLKRIVLGADGGPADSGAAPSAAARRVIAAVQTALAAQGFKPGRSDGRMSEETVRAIRVFEVDHGLVPTGRISAELIVRLERAGGQKQSAR